MPPILRAVPPIPSARLAGLIVCAALGALVPGGCVEQGGAIREAAKGAGFGPREVAAPDFVATSRPAATDYLPVGVSAPARPRARSPEEVRALETELEAARGRNEARGGVARRGVAAGSSANASASPPANPPTGGRTRPVSAPE